MAETSLHPTDIEFATNSRSLLPKNAGTTSPSRRLRLRAWAVTLTLIFILDLSNGFSDTPWLRICESIVCRNYYKAVDPNVIRNDGSIEEKHCKINPIQEELAFVVGWVPFFDLLPGLFLSVPYSILADRYGRRWLSVVNIIAISFRQAFSYVVLWFPNIFPLRMLWFQGVFTIFGGGVLVVNTLFQVVMTDVTPESQRSTMFCIGYALVFLASSIGPPLSSVLMDRNPWIPMNIGMFLTLLSIPVVLALPETLNAVKPQATILNPRQAANMGDSNEEPSLSIKGFEQIKKPNLFNRFTISLASTLQNSRFLLKDWRILFLISTAVTGMLSDASGPILSQYVSKRYSWPLSKTAYLSSFRGATSVIVLLVFLPYASHRLLKNHTLSPFAKDILLSQISFTLLTAGIFILALASSSSIFILGFFIFTMSSGAQALVRSLLTTLVKPTQVARLFTTLSIISATAMLAFQPLRVALFTWGLKQGGVWIGLPFLVSGSMVALSMVSFWVLQLGRGTRLPLSDGDGYVGDENEPGRSEGSDGLLLRDYG